MKTWYKWCKSIKEERLIEDIPPVELDRLLGHFYCKIRRTDGNFYEPDTLICFQRSLDRYLKEKHKTYSIIRDAQFASSRQKLYVACKKMLKKESKGSRSKASESQGGLSSHFSSLILSDRLLPFIIVPRIRNLSENRRLAEDSSALKLRKFFSDHSSHTYSFFIVVVNQNSSHNSSRIWLVFMFLGDTIVIIPMPWNVSLRSWVLMCWYTVSIRKRDAEW